MITETRDDQGRLIAVAFFGDPTHVWSWTKTYDAQGYCTSQIFGENPKDQSSWTRKYDPSGRLVEHIQSADMSHPMSWTYILSEDGQRINRKILAGSTTNFLSWERIYDSNGLLRQVIFSDDINHRYSRMLSKSDCDT